MDKNTFEKLYWKHYLALEEKFLETTKYVEVSEDNFTTYSIEFSAQLQSICSEIDVVLKELCKVIDNSKNPSNINAYARIILANNSDLTDIKVKDTINSGLELTPLKEWNINIDSSGNENLINPSWWKFYNKVKHQRTSYDANGNLFFKKANLENVIKSLAALYIIERYMYKLLCDTSIPGPTTPTIQSKLFRIDTQGWSNDIMLGDGMVWIENQVN